MIDHQGRARVKQSGATHRPESSGSRASRKSARSAAASPAPQSPRGGRVRCAIYTRKSSEEGLEQEFKSLDAQREACEAYVHSQRHEGWSGFCHADDGADPFDG